MSSVAEVDIRALYISTREEVYIGQILLELDHLQKQTPVQIDNSMTDEVINEKMQPKRTKAMDMCFHWIC